MKIERKDSFSSSPFTCLLVQAKKILMHEVGRENDMDSVLLELRHSL